MAILFHMTLNVAEYIIPIGIAEASLTRQLLQIGLITATATVLVLNSEMHSEKKNLSPSITQL